MRLRLGVLGSLSDTTNLRRSVSSLEKQDVFDGYTKVVISVSDDVEYSAGTDTGRTMTLVCPWGTQAIAEKLLSRVRGFQYQPFTASGAHLDPSVELGDGVTVGKVYSGIFTKDVSHGPLYTADISAPGGEKINYQYEYKSPQERKVERQNKEVRASLSIQADRITQEVTERQNQVGELRATLNVQAQQIEAKVSNEGGNSSSFGWKLTATGWSVYGNGSEKFRIDKDGAYVNGEIRATSGKIGGFDIQSNYMSYNNQTWGGTNSTGIYVGTSGIQCGANSYWRNDGYFKAVRGEFGSISVNSNGNTVGTYSGSLSDCIGSVRNLGGSVSNITGSLSTGISVGKKNIATYVGDIVANKITASYINTVMFEAQRFEMGGYKWGRQEIQYLDHNGRKRTVMAMTGQR